MEEQELHPGMHIHFVGIGGFGINPIARVMWAEGYEISGCDLAPSALAGELTGQGVPVLGGHDPDHLDRFSPDALVVSSAVPIGDPELAAARARGIPVYKRADILSALMANRVGVAVAGTHGKTTTAAMMVYVLVQAERDPTFIVGGVLRDLSTNARAGKGPAFVIEADEYDRMFMGLRPHITIVTTIELDHPDMFASVEEVRALFEAFVDLLPPAGVLIASCDDPEAFGLAFQRRASGLPTLTYGLQGEDWSADNLVPNESGGYDFDVMRKGKLMGRAGLRVPGRHNVQNSLAVFAATDHMGVSFDMTARALGTFSGVERRFEVKGEVGGVVVIDDYAHHPTAIRETLAAARIRYGKHPIWVVWQPHTYSRTQALLDEFAASFAEADHVIVTDIFPSRERDTLGVHACDVVALMSEHPDARHIGPLAEVVSYLAAHVRCGDVVLVMSAGDATTIGPALLSALEKRG